MKAICTETYYDEELHRTVGKGEELELTDKRFAELSGEKNKAKKALVRKKEDKKAQNEKEKG